MDVREMQGDARMARRKRELIGVRVHGDRRGTYRRREGKKCYKTVGNLTMGGPRPARKRTMYNATNRNPTSGKGCGQDATRCGRRHASDRARECTHRAQLILSSSTSNLSVELGGITGGKPRGPYAWKGRERSARALWTIRGKRSGDCGSGAWSGKGTNTHVVWCRGQDGLLAEGQLRYTCRVKENGIEDVR